MNSNNKNNNVASFVGTTALIGFVAILTMIAANVAQAGIAYQNPPGGWRYIFQGGNNGTGTAGTTALDGTWSYANNAGSSSWAGDGRGPGVGTIGGISKSNYVISGVNWDYITIEDATVASAASGNNTRLHFTHPTGTNGLSAAAAAQLLTNVTITFRARLTPPTDPLLELPYLREAPNGYFNASDGKGMFSVRQSNPSSIISFSLARSAEDRQDTDVGSQTQYPGWGLVMNNRNGTSPSASVDPGEGGTLVYHPCDPRAWNEFWIIITADTSQSSTHKVEVYMNGSTNASVYYVTAGTGSDIYNSINDYIGMGMPLSPATGAYDIDFFGFKEGRWTPVANPDVLGPDIVDAGTYGSTNSVKITFSEAVDPTTALNPLNYVLTNQYGIEFPIINAYFFGDSKTVVIVSSKTITPGPKYFLYASVKDLNNNLNTASWWFWQPSPAKAMVEIFGGMGNTGNPYTSPDLRSIAKFASDIPDMLIYSNWFALQTNLADTGWNYYVGRLVSYFVPPTNGYYRFYTRSDDGSLLFINTNDVNSTYPEGKVQLTQLTAYTGTYGYNSGAVSNVFLKAGQRYYMEYFWRDGSGGDGGTVALKPQGDVNLPAAGDIIPPEFLELPVGPITLQTPPPATLNVQTNTSSVTLTAGGISGALPWRIQWWRSTDNGNTFTAITGATNSSYTLPNPVTSSDNGNIYRLTISNLFSSVTYNTQIIVGQDTVPPTVKQVLGWNDGATNVVRILFSEPMNTIYSGDPLNYSIDDGAVYLYGTVISNASMVALYVDPSNPLEPGSVHKLTISLYDSLLDKADNPMSETNIWFEVAAVTTNGYIRDLAYLSLGTGNNTAVNALLTHPKFLNNTPDTVQFLSSFTVPTSSPNIDDFGLRINGYLIPSVDGFYQFRVNSDDEGRFYLSADESPDNLRLITKYADGLCCNWGWESTPVQLEANKVYYFEAYLKEGGGGDGITLNWRTPLNNNYTTIPAANLAYSIIPGKLLKIVQNPSNVTVDENGDAAFTALADSIEKGVAYKWQKSVDNGSSWTDIPGATNTAVILKQVTAADSGSMYRCAATVLVHTGAGLIGDYPVIKTTQPATLTVISDTTPPRLLSATPQYDGSTIILTFSEYVSGATALNTANYQVAGGGPVTSVSFGADQKTVILKSSFSANQPIIVIADNIKDLAGNTISPDSRSAQFTMTGPGFWADFNNLTIPQGAAIYGNAWIFPVGSYNNGPYLQLIPAVANMAGSIVIDQLSPGIPVYQFTARFKVHVGEGNVANPADGFSFNVAKDLPNSAPSGVEAGVGSGLSVCFPYYNSDYIMVKYGGVEKARVYTTVYGKAPWVDVVINLKQGGLLDVIYGGDVIFSNLVTGYVPDTNRFGIYARCGTSFANIWIDDLLITNLFTPGPITFAKNLQGVSVQSGQPVVSRVELYGTPPYTIKWYTNDIPAATNVFDYSFTPKLSDNGMYYYAAAANSFSSVTSVIAFVEVTADTTPPTIVSVDDTLSPYQLRVVFSEPVVASAANNPANYSLAPSVAVNTASLQADGKTVILGIAATTAGTTYTLTINNITDRSEAANPLTPNTATFTAGWYGLANNVIKLSRYDNISGGSTIDIFTNNAAYINNTPTSVSYSTGIIGLATPTNSSTPDNYGMIMSGFIVPQVSGVYYFQWRTDDQGIFYLSTNNTPQGLQFMAQTTAANTTVTSTNNPYLVAGQWYFFVAMFKEGTGGDYGVVTWQLPNTSTYIPVTNVALYYAVHKDNVVGISVQPTNTFTYENLLPVLFCQGQSVDMAGVTYQWQRNDGTGVFTNVPGATNRWFTNEYYIPANSQIQVRCLVTGTAKLPSGTTVSQTAISAVATITSLPDTVPPQLLDVKVNNSLKCISLIYNERVNPITATNPANYVLSGGLQVIAAKPDSTGTNVLVWTTDQTENTEYTITVLQMADTAAVPNYSYNQTKVFRSWIYLPGYVMRQFYYVTNNSTALSDFYNSPKWPYYPDTFSFTNAAHIGPTNNAQTLSDDYGAKISGYFIPRVTGNHVFYIMHDDGGALYMSSDDNPYNLRPLIFQNSSVQNTFADGANSITNSLIAGQRYYFEAVVKERGGGDYLMVAVREPGDSTPVANLPIIGSSYLATYYPPATFSNIQISLQPTPPAAYVAENVPVSITANAIMSPTNYSFMNYQWYRSANNGPFVIVPGATANTVIGYAAANESPVAYKVVAYYGDLSVTSDVSVITVSTTDTTPPTIVTVKWLNGSQLQIVFSEPVSAASASNPANYAIIDENNQTYTITSAQLLSDNKTVILNVTPLMVMDKAITVTVSGIQDRASTPNTIVTTSKTIYVYQGLIEYYAFTGISGSDIASLSNNTKFINFQPDISMLIPLIDISSWGDNYGEYLRGYYIPPVSGVYKFYIASDDNSELWLSTDDNPANKQLIALEQQYGNQRDWTSDASGRRTINPATGRYYNQSADITLQAFKRYYIEVKHKEGTGGDYVGVTAQKPGDPVPAVGSMSTMVEFSPTKLGQTVTLNAPTSITLLENDPIIISSGVTGWPAPVLQWYRNGVAIPGANGTNYYGGIATLADNGTQFYVVAGNPINTVTSQVITLNVIADTFPPTVLGVDGGFVGTPNFLVRFSEKVTPATANNVNNYQIDGGLNIIGATLLPDGSNVVLTLNPFPQQGATYNVTIANIIDRAAAANQLVQTTLTATAWYKTTNAVLVELYTGLAGGSTLNYLTNSDKYLFNSPDAKIYLTSANFSANMDYYGSRMVFYFIPPTTENYIFYVQHDDAVRVRMSTDDRPENAVVVLNRDLAGGFSTFADGLDSFTNYVEAGKSYYVEIIHKEGTGGDYVRVAAKPASDLTPPANLAPLSGSTLAVYAPPPASFVFSPLPATTNIYENVEALLTVTNYVVPTNYATGIWYQWYKNGVDIPGSNGVSYITPPLNLVDDQGAVFGVKITVPGLPTITTETSVNVLQDTTPPAILSAGSLDGYTVTVVFNELVETNLSGDPFNYRIESQGQEAIITGSAIWPDSKSVLLFIDPSTPLVGSFRIEASGISDIAYTPNEIPAEFPSVFIGKVAHLTAADVGTYGTSGFGGGVGVPTLNAALPGYTWYFTNDAMRVSANGWDIWNNNDGFHYVYRQVTGNFDIKVRVESLTRADNWSKAGIMARLSTNAGSRFIIVMTTPTNGQNMIGVQWRDTADGTCGSIHGGSGGPVVNPAYPNQWLRLQRIGSVINCYYSTNGVDWNMYTNRDTAAFGGAYPDTILVGLAVVSHNQTLLTNNAVAEFRELMFPLPPTIVQQPSPAQLTVNIHQPINITVGATAAPESTITYQWKKNGIDIPGANSATLTIANANVADSGVYTVVVGNEGGQVTSDPVTVTVINQLPVVQNDTVAAGSGQQLNIPVSQLIANDSDPEGDQLLIYALSGVAPQTFVTDFESGLPAGANIYGAAVVDTTGGVNDGGCLKLTPATGSQSGSLVIDELTPGKKVSGFTATFKIRIADGSTEPADGFSLNFATDIPDAATGATAAEDGIGTGLSICIDNYRFTGAANTAGMKVKWQTNIIAQQQTAVWSSQAYIPVQVTLTPSGQLTVIVAGTNVFGTVVITNYAPSTGRFGLFARTGGSYEAHWIDDLSITVITETTGSGGSVTLAGDNITYTPPQDAAGMDAFYYIVSDGQEGGLGIGRVSVNVALNTVEDTPVQFSLCNIDIWKGDLQYQITSQPTHGALSDIVSGTLTYTPAADFNGVDSFTYSVSDGTTTAIATVTINVANAYDAPTAGSLTQTLVEDNSLVFQLPVTNPDNVQLTYAITRQPAHGAINLVNGTVTYTPINNFNGTDSFEYSVSDGTTTVTGEIQVNVTPINDVRPYTFNQAVNYQTGGTNPIA
ncbi:MAG: PA14 domain-containing protein, partial [Verrucomicrobiia bacterium]